MQPLERAGETRRLSHSGGFQPQWRADGKELFYLSPDGNIMVADFEAAYAGQKRARALFHAPVLPGPGLASGDQYAVTSDGQRFLIVETPQERPDHRYTVLMDWRRALERR